VVRQFFAELPVEKRFGQSAKTDRPWTFRLIDRLPITPTIHCAAAYRLPDADSAFAKAQFRRLV
jgi:hypothetical protein